MYHYNKTKANSRQTVTPKESHIFGPYFTVQPSNSGAINERQKPNSADVRKEGADLAGGLGTNSNLFRRLTHPTESPTLLPGDKASGSGNLVKARLAGSQLYHDTSSSNIGDMALNGDSRAHSASVASHKHQKTPPLVPGDRVIFTESPSYPGTPIVYRTHDERSQNPDRLNLDRRKLTLCPMLEGEDQLRLLNYQHNYIAEIAHLAHLRRLIFLDLYDNQISRIDGLNTLRSLRVLMLGKNRIKKIENLQSLVKLDVLDLHGNQITIIENLSHLRELRVLNLAGNAISHVDDLAGMDALAELNLRRNRIKTMNDVDNLPCLQRLFLSFNEIESYDDIRCLGYSGSLSEISLDGNPIFGENNYKQIILRHLPQLKLLDMKRVSEEERRIAVVMSRKEEEKKREMNRAAVIKEKRRLVINNAKKHWEAAQVKVRGGVGMPDIYANHVATVINAHSSMDDDTESASGGSRPASSRSAKNSSRLDRPRSAKTDKEPLMLSSVGGTDPAMSHLAELDTDTLNLYGPGSLEALDRNWGIQAAGTVTCISFSFIPFNEIARNLYKVRARFPSVNSLKFFATNIESLHQLNALAGLRRLEQIHIDQDGNPVTRFHLWRYYLLYRLGHFNLKKINDVDVLAIDVMNSEAVFRPLAGVIAASLPHSKLFSLLSDNRRKQLLANDEKTSKTLESKLSESRCSDTVTKAALSYVPKPDEDEQLASTSKKQSHASGNPRRVFAQHYIRDLKKEAVHVNVKRSELQTIWPQVYMDMVKNAVMDMALDRTAYMRKCLEELDLRSGDG